MVTIHVIDGDAAVRLAARQVLERAGFTVSDAAVAGGPAQADGPVRADGSGRPAPALVIADPGIAGAATIRRLHPGAKILAFCGSGTGLGKPFTPSQLLTAVRRSLAQPAATTATGRRTPPPARPRS